MSLDATRWAWTRPSVTSSQRLVLLALADRADEQSRCYPSVRRLAEDTCLNRKTVLATVTELLAKGLLADTGGRVGNGVRVLQLVGVEHREEPVTGTEIGTGTKNGTGTEIGTTTGTKNGTATGPNIGTLNLSGNLPGNRKRPRKRPTPIPEDFQITPRMREWAKAKGIRFDLSHETEKFIEHHTSKGNTFASHEAAWRNWMLKAVDYQGHKPQEQELKHWL